MEPHLQRLPEFVKAIRSIQETIITNIVLIGQTPSPTFREKRRTEVFLDRLTDYQVDECTIDGYGNPIGIIRGTSVSQPPIFVVAHLDTHHQSENEFNYEVGSNFIKGPGITDNSTGVAVLASLPDIFRKLNLLDGVAIHTSDQNPPIYEIEKVFLSTGPLANIHIIL